VCTENEGVYRNCFLKPTNLLAESESYMKDSKIKGGIFRVLCLAAKNHGQSFSRFTLLLFSVFPRNPTDEKNVSSTLQMFK